MGDPSPLPPAGTLARERGNLEFLIATPVRTHAISGLFVVSTRVAARRFSKRLG